MRQRVSNLAPEGQLGIETDMTNNSGEDFFQHGLFVTKISTFSRNLLIAALVPALLTGCGITPRGAALQSEVLRGTDDENSTVQVVEVTRASLREVDDWPVARNSERHNWISTNSGGSARLIRAGDSISLAIWDSQSDSLLTNAEQRSVNMQNIPVSSSGRVFIPYAGEVRISGMTVDQARREIQDRLTPIVPDGQVQLSVAAGSNNTIDVVSGVQRPGRIDLPEISPTILSVIAQAGGISPSLRNPLVRLNRAGQSYAIPSRELFANPARDIRLRGGDRVVVEEDARSYIALGAAGREQVVYFERETVTALDALSTIGGLSDSRADLNGLMVLREYAASAVRPTGHAPRKQQVVFTFDLASAEGLFAARNFEIQPNDVVLAAESPLPVIAQIVGIFRTVRSATN